MTSTKNRTLRVGTRGSLLARTQTGHVTAALQQHFPDLEIETIIIRTSGDRNQREVVGAFVRELQEALRRDEIDIAVHSLKDLPTDRPDGLVLAAMPPRQDPREAVICTAGNFASLKLGAKLGTGSLRRTAQVRSLRPDIECLPLMGNVDTRLRKLVEGEYDAIILAVAGIKRAGFPLTPDGNEFILHVHDTDLRVDMMDPEILMPCAGQGALAIECSESNLWAREIVSVLNDSDTVTAVTAERSLLNGLGGGCQTPVAAHAIVIDGICHLKALVVAPDGTKSIADSASGPSEDSVALGMSMSQNLLSAGAASFLPSQSI